MSTTTRNRRSAVRGGKGSAAPQLGEMLAGAKEALQTKNGHLLIFLIQFLLSFLTLFYFRGVVRAAYNSMFYRLEIPEGERGTYCFLAVMVCIFYGAIMLFTRRQIVTKLVIMCSMPFYLPIFLFNFQHLVLIVPLGILVVITYLASGTSEGPKTIFGAVFLMLYILGAFVFLTVQSILQPATTETVVARDITPNGTYRYSVVMVQDQGDGNTYVTLEPNTADLEYSHSKWYAKGFRHDVYHTRPLSEIDVEWQTQSRADITRELISNNPNTTFTLDADQMRLLGLNVGYAEEMTVGDLSRTQRHKLGYGSMKDPIDSRLARLFHVILVDDDYAVTLDFDTMVSIGLNPTFDLRLSHLTDENLAALGVPEENEVLLVNGKVVFRQYVAELERTFWDSSRDLTAFLESNTVPEVHPEGVEIPEPAETTATTTETTETTTETTETTVDTTVAALW